MSDYFIALIHKYLDNKCSEDEAKIVLQYLETKKGQAYLSNQIDKDIVQLQDLVKNHKSHYVDYENVLSKIYQDIATGYQKKEGKVKKTIKIYQIAAVIAGILIMTAVYQFFLAEQLIIHQTTYGETKKIELNDGTQIILNANSTLRYSSAFDQERKVWLDGEAFFQVKEIAANEERQPLATQDKLVKFTVHTETLAVEVTGTSFNVNDRGNKTQVVLNTGEIRLKTQIHKKKQEDILTMQPGDMVEIFESDGKMVKRVVNPEVYTSWKDNKLVCYDTPLKSIAQTVKNNYGMQMNFESSDFSEMIVTGTLPTKNLDLLLEVLAESMELHIEKNGNIIFIKKNKK